MLTRFFSVFVSRNCFRDILSIQVGHLTQFFYRQLTPREHSNKVLLVLPPNLIHQVGYGCDNFAVFAFKIVCLGRQGKSSTPLLCFRDFELQPFRISVVGSPGLAYGCNLLFLKFQVPSPLESG